VTVAKKFTSFDQRKKLLKKIIPILENNNIGYWLEFGTLLGLIREKGFIKWDSDIDMGTFDFEKLYKMREQFKKQGLQTEILYDYTNDMASIFRIRDNNNVFHAEICQFTKLKEGAIIKTVRYNTIISKIFRTAYNILRRHEITVNIFSKTAIFFSNKRIFIYPRIKVKDAIFYTIGVKIPANPENHLRLMYGDTWRTPTKEDIAGKQFIIEQQKKLTIYKLPDKRVNK